jgi:hypothetical protein
MNAFLDTLELIVHTMVEKFSWIPVDEVARILKMSVNTMTGLADSGLIPCKRNGGMIYFRSEDINDYMQAHKVKATPKA